MQYKTFPLICVNSELPAILLDNGEWLFHAPDVCIFADLVIRRDNASHWVRTNLPSKWFIEFRPTGKVGRPGLYLTLPGLLNALTQGTSEISLKFRDEVFEKILPSIITDGFYISKTATNEQLEAAQKEIAQLQLEKKYLKAWSPNISLPKMRLLDLINYKAHEYSPFLTSNGYGTNQPLDSYNKNRFTAAQLEGQILFDLIDTLFTDEKLECSKYGFKKAEGLQKRIPYKLFRVLQLSHNGQHQKLSSKFEYLEQSIILKKEYNYFMWLEYAPDKEQQLKSYLFESEELVKN